MLSAQFQELTVPGVRVKSSLGQKKTCVQYHMGGRISDTWIFAHCINTAPKQRSTEEAGSSTTENLLVIYRF